MALWFKAFYFYLAIECGNSISISVRRVANKAEESSGQRGWRGARRERASLAQECATADKCHGSVVEKVLYQNVAQLFRGLPKVCVCLTLCASIWPVLEAERDCSGQPSYLITWRAATVKYVRKKAIHLFS